jgi:hypothetical protein
LQLWWLVSFYSLVNVHFVLTTWTQDVLCNFSRQRGITYMYARNTFFKINFSEKFLTLRTIPYLCNCLIFCVEKTNAWSNIFCALNFRRHLHIDQKN